MKRTIIFLFFMATFIGIASQAQTQRERDITRYKAYRNLPLKPLIIIPFISSTLSPSVCAILNKNFINEIEKTRRFKILNLEQGFDVDAAIGQDYRNIDLFKLSNSALVEYIICPSIEKMGNLFEIKAKLFDTKLNKLMKSYSQECNCPFEEVVFWILPDIAENFSETEFDLQEKCPSEMITIQAGEFTMGTNYEYDNNPPKAQYTRNYCIDKYEHPNRESEFPTVGLSWYDANEKCLEAGKRLCYEEEWERACRGEFNFIYPYSNSYDKQICVTKEDDIQKSGVFPNCHGETGIYDMSGNVGEWTGSAWDENIQNKTIRGGAWSSGKENSRCTLRYSNKPATTSKTIGFRCCETLF